MQDTITTSDSAVTDSGRPLPRWLTDQQAGILVPLQEPPPAQNNPIVTSLTVTGAGILLLVVVGVFMILRKK